MTRPDSPNRICSECAKSISHLSAKAVTCSSRCRGARARRLKRLETTKSERTKAATRRTPGAQALYELIEGEVDDVAKAVINEELRPIVRDSITEDTLRAIHDLVGLTPMAVAAIREDIEGTLMEDGTFEVNVERRQKAYTLLMRYTVGHGAIVQQQDPTPPAINVVFPGMERPADSPAPQQVDAEIAPDEVEEDPLQECVYCNEFKSPDQFVGQSPRCITCHEKLQQKARDLESGLADGTGRG